MSEYKCSKLEDRVIATEEWEANHNWHLIGASQSRYGREDVKHPSGRWWNLVCPCGAKHLCILAAPDDLPPAAASCSENDAVEAARKSEKSLAREKGESQ